MSTSYHRKNTSTSENDFEHIFTSHELPKDHTFIYALFDEDKIVYIGRTKCLLQRIGAHHSDKKFSGYGYFIVPDGIACVEELKMYGKYRPKYNKQPPDSKYYFSLQTYRLKNNLGGYMKKIRLYLVENQPDEIAGLYHIDFLDRMKKEVRNG